MVSGSRRRWVFVFRFRGRTRQPRPCTRRSTFGFFFARFRLILVFILFFGLSFLLVRVPVVRGVPVHSGFAVNVTRIYESCSWIHSCSCCYCSSSDLLPHGSASSFFCFFHPVRCVHRHAAVMRCSPPAAVSNGWRILSGLETKPRGKRDGTPRCFVL